MELILAIGIGVLAGSGVWLILRPRSFQVIIGLSLLSYAVNLFIFSMGRLGTGAPPVVDPSVPMDTSIFTDPLPQALVLTAIVIGFAMSALFPRCLDRFARVDRHRPRRWQGGRSMSTMIDHLIIIPILLPLLVGRQPAAVQRSQAAAKAFVALCHDAGPHGNRCPAAGPHRR